MHHTSSKDDTRWLGCCCISPTLETTGSGRYGPTAPFASVSFEFPLGDHLHLCRQSFCFRVHQSNEKIELGFLCGLFCLVYGATLLRRCWFLWIGWRHSMLVLSIRCWSSTYLQYCIISCVFSSVDFSFSFSNAGGMWSEGRNGRAKTFLGNLYTLSRSL
jgi:hypothetical protein